MLFLTGCDSTQHTFVSSKDLDASIDCTLCFPASTRANNTTPDDRCAEYKDAPFVVYACTTDCATIFFSGAGTLPKAGQPDTRPPITLDVFVLVPVLWLPFAVYSNNEVARMIDGIWQRKKELAKGAEL